MKIKGKGKMKKIISFVLCIVMLQMLLSGCSSSEGTKVDAPEGYVGVTNDAIHFSVCYPQSWICDRNDGMISFSPAGDSSSKASISVHESSAMVEAVSPADYWSKSKEELEKSGNKCNFLESKEMKLGDVDACQAIYGMEVGGNAYKVTQIFAYKYIDSSHRMFTITFTGTEADYENNDVNSAFKTAVSTFLFKE